MVGRKKTKLSQIGLHRMRAATREKREKDALNTQAQLKFFQESNPMETHSSAENAWCHRPCSRCSFGIECISIAYSDDGSLSQWTEVWYNERKAGPGGNLFAPTVVFQARVLTAHRRARGLSSLRSLLPTLSRHPRRLDRGSQQAEK